MSLVPFGSRGAPRACLTLSVVSAALALTPLVTPAVAADACPNAAVRAQQRATHLPDCRAYELVNPPGNDIGEVNRVPNVSDDGNVVVYTSVVLGDDAFGGATSSIAVARRGASGWNSTNADPKSSGALTAGLGVTEVIDFSFDYSRAFVYSSLPLLDSDQDTLSDYYILNVGKGTSTLATPGLVSFPFSPIGASLDLDRVIYNAISDPADLGIYAFDSSGVHRLNVDENGNVLSNATRASTAADRGLGVGLVSGSHRPFVERGGTHSVSDDGQRVFFNAGAGELYLNDHGIGVPISASQRTGDVGTLYPGGFLSAARDGSSVYFNSEAQLTDAATPGGGIYRYDVGSHALVQITPDAGDPTGLHLHGAMVSYDQSHVYFTSTSVLAAGASAGSNNAYVWTADKGTRFIVTLGPSDLIDRVTPNGRFALVLSSTSIGGVLNNGYQAIYRYDDLDGTFTCVSCRPDGAPSQGSATIDGQGYGIPNAPNYHNRAVAEDGSVAFMSTDSIVRNDQTSAQDVYLYRHGAVSLLTAGSGDSDSYIGDISDDAKNVLVVTRSAFVAADQDSQEDDVYDIRVDGGFLATQGGDRCRGDDCQDPPAPRAIPSSPATTSVTSSGDVRPNKVTKRITTRTLTASQRSTLARTGKVTISVRATGAGTVSIRGRGRVAGRTATVGSGRGSALLRRPTTVGVTFRLTTAAKRELSRRHRLSFTLQTRLSGVSKPVRSTVHLSRR